MLLHVLGSRLPLDVARLVLEHGASTTIQARARGLLARRGPLPSRVRHGFAPCDEGEYAYEGTGPVGESLARWCGALRPGVYWLDVSLSYADGTVTYIPAGFAVGPTGVRCWHAPLLRELAMLQHAFEPHHGAARVRVRVGRGGGACAETRGESRAVVHYSLAEEAE